MHSEGKYVCYIWFNELCTWLKTKQLFWYLTILWGGFRAAWFWAVAICSLGRHTAIVSCKRMEVRQLETLNRSECFKWLQTITITESAQDVVLWYCPITWIFFRYLPAEQWCSGCWSSEGDIAWGTCIVYHTFMRWFAEIVCIPIYIEYQKINLMCPIFGSDICNIKDKEYIHRYCLQLLQCFLYAYFGAKCK